MGYFYAGAKTNQRTNAYAKIGETNQRFLSQRTTKIRHQEGNFFVIRYLEIPNSTQAITRAVEGHVRMMLERKGYKNIQNDHYVWETTIEEKMKDYELFAKRAMYYAKQYCDVMNIKYTEHKGKANARKTIKRKKTLDK